MGGDSGDGNDSSNSNSLITNKVSFQFFNDGSYTGDLGSIMKLGGRYTLNGNQASLSVATFNGMPIEKVTALAKARNADSMVPSDLGLTGTLNADGTKLELKFSSPVMGGMAINLTR